MDASKVSVAITGAISKIADAEAITSASSTLPTEGTKTYGFVSDEGVTISTDSSTNSITAWQNSAVVRVASTEASASYSFTLIENTSDSRELYYGAREIGGKILFKPSEATQGTFVIDYIDAGYGDEGEILYGRHVLPRARVVERGDIVLQNGEPIGYNVTVQAFPDGDGVVAHIYHGAGDTPEVPNDEEFTA